MSRKRPAPPPTYHRLAVLAALVPLACLAALPPENTPQAPGQTPESLAGAESERLRQALTRALEEGAAQSGLRLFAEGFDQGDHVTVEVYGHGVGIWDGTRQFQASREEPEILHILDRVVLLLWPSINPDGQTLMVDWYRSNLGTQYEVAPMIPLHQNYVGHDNNRDVFMVNMIESRVVNRVVLLGLRPQWRAQPFGTFPILFNAALFGADLAAATPANATFWEPPKSPQASGDDGEEASGAEVDGEAQAGHRAGP